MPSKSTKSTSTKKAGNPVTRKVSSKKLSTAALHARYQYVAGAVLVAAALLATAGAFNSYKKKSYVVTQPINSASMYMKSDGSNRAPAGSTFSVKVYENSGANPINAVQSVVHYPADKVQFVSFNPGADFPQEAATDDATPGLVRFARSVDFKAAAVTGPKHIATLVFKVLPTANDSVTLTFDKSSSLVVRSTDNKNLLLQAPSATYLIQ